VILVDWHRGEVVGFAECHRTAGAISWTRSATKASRSSPGARL